MYMYKHTCLIWYVYNTTPTPKAQESPEEGQNNCKSQKSRTCAAI